MHQPFAQYQLRDIVGGILRQLELLVRLERHMLGIIASYAVAIGLFMLCVPIAVQELVSTFSFAVEPIMIFTLATIVGLALTGAASFRVLQARAVETLQQRIYTRIAIAFTDTLPRLQEESFLPQHANRFAEADLLTRALVAMVADLFNVAVVGSIGMGLLVFFHPYFLLYNVTLIAGFLVLLTVFGRGGFLITLEMSRLHYELYHWIQNIAANLPHLRAAGYSPYLLSRTDALTQAYVRVRQRRSDLLTGRQYKAATLWQAAGHAGMIATAGMLVSIGQLTVGQFAAAELIAGNLLLNMDTLARRMVHMFFAFVSFREMNAFFSLPQDRSGHKSVIPVDDFGLAGIRVSAKNVSFGYPDAPLLFEEVNVEVAPGEKVMMLCRTNTQKTALAKVLAGLMAPTAGAVLYNDVNLVEVDLRSVDSRRSLMLDSQPTLLEGTIEDNITLGRPSIRYEDVQWALQFVELDDEIDALPDGLSTPVTGHGGQFTLSQTLRLLLARAIVIRPYVLIVDGTFHSMVPSVREVILRRLCSKDEPWSIIFVSNDPTFAHAERRVVVG
ncbi:ABC transporter ATP-binding protein [Nitrospira moscoviensis]|uniref:Putative ABC-type transport system, ATPase and permease component n=1 Tax=Nitrospira moscoviensis TaxID=42253 RepID=A0A0K2GIP0_NITMO|nr:ABC transporter ATP-binding protein [Nitrospira moscoviensis]ALA60806.1 putative ABC-type transport system, ATPase and permease component [Nitrospira moscoviensis]